MRFKFLINQAFDPTIAMSTSSSAASKNGDTGYNMTWIRDNIYESLGFEAVGNLKEVIKTYQPDVFVIGSDYKDKKKLVLKFGSDDLNVYLTTILQQEWKPKYIFLKLPSNYDFETFTNLPNIHTTIHKFQIRGFYLLGIKTLN